MFCPTCEPPPLFTSEVTADEEKVIVVGEELIVTPGPEARDLKLKVRVVGVTVVEA
jgi:hypothetical protein